MTWAVQCPDCETTTWPPAEAEGTGGRSEIAALRLALDHATDTGHDVDVTPGCYYVGDGVRPEGFDGGAEPDDYVTPERGNLVDDLESAIRTLEDAADELGETDVTRDLQARHLREWAGLIERKQREREEGDHDV